MSLRLMPLVVGAQKQAQPLPHMQNVGRVLCKQKLRPNPRLKPRQRPKSRQRQRVRHKQRQKQRQGQRLTQLRDLKEEEPRCRSQTMWNLALAANVEMQVAVFAANVLA